MTTKSGQEQLPGERAIHKCSTWVFVRLIAAAAAIVYQESHFWRTEGQQLFRFLFDQKNFLFESIATHDLI